MEICIACLDFGGSSIKTALCRKDGTIISKSSYPIKKNIEEFLDTIVDYINVSKKKYIIEGIAISSCGAVNCESGVISGVSAIPFIHGPSWKTLILEKTGIECEIENDANCAALSELYFGKAQGISNMVFIVIGTGVGGAIVINGEIHHGSNLYGGEFGMMLVNNDKKLENYSLIASTSSMVRKMKELEPGEWDGVKIFNEATKGNSNCEKVIHVFYDNIALGAFNIQHMIDPQLILFGGAISARKDFKQQVEIAYQKLISQINFEVITPKFECCTFLQDANLLGALANFLHRRSTRGSRYL